MSTAAVPREATRGSDEATGHRVLIAAASDQSRDLVRTLLPLDCVVDEAMSAEQTLALYSRHTHDCVLLDTDLLQSRRASLVDRLASGGAAIVVLADSSEQPPAMTCMRAGAQDYFIKRHLNTAALARVVAYSAERSMLLRENLRVVAALRESERRFHDVVNRIEEGLWLRDASGEFIYVSPAFERIWGRSMAELLDGGPLPFVHPDDAEHCQDVFRSHVLSGHEFSQEFRVVRPDGDVRHVISNGYPVRDECGQLLRIGGIVRDVTASLRQEQALRLAQKLEAIGQLAAGIAHEINTPSQYVSDNLAFLAGAMDDLQPVMRAFARLADGAACDASDLARLRDSADLDFLIEEMPAALDQARHGIGQIKQIVLAMKDFSHPGEDKEPTDLNRAISSTVTVARNEWKYVAEVDLQLDDSLPAVPCVPSAINQVVLNLVVNAAQAIGEQQRGPAEGRIVVRTSHDERVAIVEVEDDGPGIPTDLLTRVFDPFFTTKDVGKGTGQGLALAYTVIRERHAGDIRVYSEPGSGTRFVFTLPLQVAGLQA